MAKGKFERTKPHVNVGTIGEWLKQDPDMNPLRDEQRYKELVRLIDSEAEAQVAQPAVSAPVTGDD